MSTIYRITYPNGKIYIGQDRTNSINYFGQTAVMDGQGRVLIHPLLREKAEIDGEVAVLGQQQFLEVWSRARFEEQLEQNPLTDDHLRELATLGF